MTTKIGKRSLQDKSGGISLPVAGTMVWEKRASFDMTPTAPSAVTFHDVGPDRVRLLRDGREAFPAMLEAIANAKREVLLEMYWLAADRVGGRFVDALVERARAGILVRVLFDSVGSFETPADFWRPLVEAGGDVHEFAPVSPLAHRFRWGRIFHRDHRKLLVVDGSLSVIGGINIGEQWDPPETPERAWRDDALEIRGPSAHALRRAFYDVWRRCRRQVPDDAGRKAPRPGPSPRLRVLTNRIEVPPNNAITGAYRARVRHSLRSVDIASAYFLPGPRFLRALRAAARRGVRVRILVPERSDVPVVSLAMNSLWGRLLASGVEIYVYLPRILHSKTAVFDGRHTMIGSHNLDSVSWRYNLEANVLVDSNSLGQDVEASFEADLREARRIDLESWRSRPLWLRSLAWLAALLRPFL